MSGAWIVTGGAGFIGCNFVRYALAHTDTRLVILDKLTYAGSLASLQDVLEDRRVTFVHGDIGDAGLVDRLLAGHGPAAVLNFAAETHVDRSIDEPGAFVQTNLVGTFTLLECGRRYWSGLDTAARGAFRLLHVSTDEVYGTLGADGAFAESTPYAPNSPYAATKAGADHLVRAWFHTFGLPGLVTNCSNNYGPYQFPEKLIPLMILNALEARPLPIYGDGLNVRDWLFVEDHCAGIHAVLERGRPGERYNIGGDNERTNLEMVGTLCDLLDRQAPPAANPTMVRHGHRSYRELQTFVPDRPGHDRRYAIDATRIRSELRWRPAHDLAAGLGRTVAWYLANREWCREVQEGRYERQRLGLG
jgi:dTDP-glucose 4,6-dehydratase